MILDLFLKLFFPHFCVGCKKEGDIICGLCLEKIMVNPYYHQEFRCWSWYILGDKNVKTLLHLLKYDAVRGVAKIVTEHICHKKEFLEIFPKNLHYYWLPIPVSAHRLKERGYNQVAWVAEEMRRIYGGTVLTNVLCKHQRESFVGKSKEERKTLAKGMFYIKKSRIPEDARVVLLDDVVTTGSTLKEAQHTLEQAGIGLYISLVLAREI